MMRKRRMCDRLRNNSPKLPGLRMGGPNRITALLLVVFLTAGHLGAPAFAVAETDSGTRVITRKTVENEDLHDSGNTGQPGFLTDGGKSESASDLAPEKDGASADEGAGEDDPNNYDNSEDSKKDSSSGGSESGGSENDGSDNSEESQDGEDGEEGPNSPEDDLEMAEEEPPHEEEEPLPEQDHLFPVWSGEGTEDDPYLIVSNNDLFVLAAAVNTGSSFAGKYFTLADDISLSGECWRPIGSDGAVFSGCFNGDGNTVSGLDVEAESYGGLFGYVKNAVIENLTVSGSVAVDSHGGGLAGSAENSVFHNITSDVAVSVLNHGGGIVGAGRNLVITTSQANGEVYAAGNSAPDDVVYYLGGIAGSLSGTDDFQTHVSSCSASQIVEAAGNYSDISSIGGLVGGYQGLGSASLQITGSVAAGVAVGSADTAAVRDTGGLVGSVTGPGTAALEGCTVNGQVSAEARLIIRSGGLVGHVAVPESFQLKNCDSDIALFMTGESLQDIGGLTGRANEMKAEAVSVTGGMDLTAAGSANRFDVAERLGGLSGLVADGEAAVSRSFRTGRIEVHSRVPVYRVGGFLGSSQDITVEESFHHGVLLVDGGETAELAAVGGFLGYAANGSAISVKDSYVTGGLDVPSAKAAGMFFGQADGAEHSCVTRSYAAVAVPESQLPAENPEERVTGMTANLEFESVYYDAELSGIILNEDTAGAEGLTGLPTLEMVRENPQSAARKDGLPAAMPDLFTSGKWKTSPNSTVNPATGYYPQLLMMESQPAVSESSTAATAYYYIKLHGNGGTTSPEEGGLSTVEGWYQYCNEGTAINPGFIHPAGYLLTAWSKESAGGAGIPAEALYPDADYELYAQWQAPEPNREFHIYYDANGAGGEAPTDSNLYHLNEEATVLGRGALSMPGYSFSGWSRVKNSSADLLAPGSVIVVTGDLTLYAQWKKDGSGGPGPGGGSSYDVAYHANNGLNEASITSSHRANATVTVRQGSIFTAPAGSEFSGWSDSENGAVIYYAGDTFLMPSRNVNLYAVWTTADNRGNREEIPRLNKDDHYAYVVGYPDMTVRPQNNITREEAASIFFRLLEEESRSAWYARTNIFSDVDSGRWSNVSVSTLSAAGVLSGYPDGTFRPEEAITRAEFAVIVSRFSSGSTGNNSIRFNDTSGHWAESYINQGAGLGWISGDPDGSFRPEDPITRAEVMSLTNRVLERRVESKADLLTSMVLWNDNSDERAWYYLDVQEATHSHDYEPKADGRAEKWTALRPDPDWRSLERPVR